MLWFKHLFGITLYCNITCQTINWKIHMKTIAYFYMTHLKVYAQKIKWSVICLMTEFLKTVQIYFKRYPSSFWSLKRAIIVSQTCLCHFESTLFVKCLKKLFLKKLKRLGTSTDKQTTCWILKLNFAYSHSNACTTIEMSLIKRIIFIWNNNTWYQ